MARDFPGPSELISAVVALLASLFLVAFPFTVGPRFQQLFADFGGELPGLTRLALSAWFAPLLGLLGVSAVGGALFGGLPAFGRRFAVMGALALVLGAVLACVLALYVPIFTLAERIQ